jgi:uncharacterized repeat protein (TIGR03803 family)
MPSQRVHGRSKAFEEIPMSFRSLKSLPVFAALATVMVTLTFGGLTVPAQAQTYTILDNFLTGGPGPQWPGGPLLQGRDGDLYGDSYLGGATNNGSIWKTSPAGTVSVVHSFASGNDCQSGLTLGTDGNFYGSGLSNCAAPGYIFKMTPAGVITILHTFTGQPDGSGPSGLVQYTDGNFYGTTSKGGANNFGSVFKITPAGVLTTIYSFDNTNNFSGPTSGLTVGNDSDFYGTQVGGDGLGGIFKITPAGVLTLLHHFTGNPDGAGPSSGVILGKDGNFYGVTQFGGTVGDGRVDQGTFFKMTPAGVVTVLHSFNPTTDYAVFPTTPLIQATDGDFYSTSNACNEFLSCGSFVDIYKLTPTGTLTVVEKLTGANGAGAYWTLTQHTNGTLYGITQQGGTVNGGVYFSLNIGAKAFISLVSTAGRVGSKIGILGQGFSASSVVKFNGVAATTVTRTGTTFLLATVPAGASNGYVTVTTGTNTLTSSKKFIVHNSWGSGAAMPTAVYNPATGVLSGKIYVVGGFTTATIADMQIYDPAANTWSTGVSLPTATDTAASAVVNNTLYVIGGSHPGVDSTAVWAFNPTTKAWSAKAPMPTGRNGVRAVVEKNIIYVMGGYNGTDFIDTVESYNPATNTWKEEAPMLGTKDIPAAGLIGTTIVVAGGANAPGSITGDTEGYNATTNTWSTLTADPTPRTGPCDGVIGSQLYDVGGYINNAGAATTVNESFSLSADKWTTTLAAMPQGSLFAGSAVYNGQLYCMGGEATWTANPISNVQIYQP